MFGGQNQQRSRVVPSVGSRLYDMLNSDVLTDVTFIVQGTEIKGHKVIASSHGGLLRELIETSENNRIEITEEVAPHTFKTVLQYIYTDSSEIDNKNLFELMHVARIFSLESLKDLCATTLKSKLSYKNVGVFTSQALQFDVKEYVNTCQEYFRIYTLETIKAQEFLNISYDALLTLCNTDGIQCTAIVLFDICHKWAKEECQRKCFRSTSENIRIVLGEILCNKKFTKMSQQDFHKHVVPTGILTPEEVGHIVIGMSKGKENVWIELPGKVSPDAAFAEIDRQQLPTWAFGTASMRGSQFRKGINFGASSRAGSSGLFSNTFAFNQQNKAVGSTIKFNPPHEMNTEIRKVTHHQCITAMEEYKDQSLEELRWDDYTMNYNPKGFLSGSTAAPIAPFTQFGASSFGRVSKKPEKTSFTSGSTPFSFGLPSKKQATASATSGFASGSTTTNTRGSTPFSSFGFGQSSTKPAVADANLGFWLGSTTTTNTGSKPFGAFRFGQSSTKQATADANSTTQSDNKHDKPLSFAMSTNDAESTGLSRGWPTTMKASSTNGNSATTSSAGFTFGQPTATAASRLSGDGATTGSAGFTFSQPTTTTASSLSGNGASIGRAGFTFSQPTTTTASSLSGDGATTGSAGFTFSQPTTTTASSLSGNGASIGRAGFTFSQPTTTTASSLSGDGTTTGSAGFTFSQPTTTTASSLSGNGATTCSAGFTFSQPTTTTASSLSGNGATTCSAGFTFSQPTTTTASSLSGNGATTGHAGFTFSQSTTAKASSLSGNGATTGSAGFTFSQSTTTTASSLSGNGATTGSAGFTFSQSTTTTASSLSGNGATTGSAGFTFKQPSTAMGSSLSGNGASAGSLGFAIGRPSTTSGASGIFGTVGIVTTSSSTGFTFKQLTTTSSTSGTFGSSRPVQSDGSKTSGPNPVLSTIRRLEDLLNFKPKPNEWKCKVCLVQNKSDVIKCVCCSTQRPGVTETSKGETAPALSTSGALSSSSNLGFVSSVGGFTFASSAFPGCSTTLSPVLGSKASPGLGIYASPAICSTVSTGFSSISSPVIGSSTSPSYAPLSPVLSSTSPTWLSSVDSPTVPKYSGTISLGHAFPMPVSNASPGLSVTASHGLGSTVSSGLTATTTKTGTTTLTDDSTLSAALERLSISQSHRCNETLTVTATSTENASASTAPDDSGLETDIENENGTPYGIQCASLEYEIDPVGKCVAEDQQDQEPKVKEKENPQ